MSLKLKQLLATLALEGTRTMLYDNKGEGFMPAEALAKSLVTAGSEISTTEYLEICDKNGFNPEEDPLDLANQTLSAEDRATRKTAYLAKLVSENKASKVLEQDRILTFRASDESVDRAGDIVRVAGWEFTDFEKNPVFLDGHDYRKAPIGRVVKVWKEESDSGAATGKSIMARVYFPNKDISEASDAAYRGVKGGLYSAVSVGFQPSSINNPEGQEERDALGLGRYGVEFLKQKLWELSLVTVPANSNALVINSAEHAEICTKMGVPFELTEKTIESSAPDISAEIKGFREEISGLRADIKSILGLFKDLSETVKTIEQSCVEIITRSIKSDANDGGAGPSQKAPDAVEAPDSFEKALEAIKGLKVS